MTAEKAEYYRKLDAVARQWLKELRNELRQSGESRKPPISTDTNQTEKAIRNFLKTMGFQNASTINKATMLYLIYKGIEGGFEYIGVDSDNPTLEQMESAVQDMAENIGISPKQLLDWEFTVWQ